MINIKHNTPALVLAPMDGVTDAPMRAVQGESGAFTFAVSEFLRVSVEALPKKTFHKYVPELLSDGLTLSGLPVQVQLLGGDSGRMAQSAFAAFEAGAKAIDINFGCPAPTVNRHDGGATLLKYPERIREIVRAVRNAVPIDIPVSAKLRLGWDTLDAIYENADMAAEGGASWLTIHGRTRAQGYAPPAYWNPIGQVRARVGIPVTANGDIWNIEEFRRCQEETGCIHFMLGRGALANPLLSRQVASELGLLPAVDRLKTDAPFDWIPLLERLVEYTHIFSENASYQTVRRIKQWLSMASKFGDFKDFDSVKRALSTEEIFETLANIRNGSTTSSSPVILTDSLVSS